MGISDIWDRIVDELEYLISFEWIGDIGEFFFGLFEGLGEFSIAGTLGGIIGVVLTNLTLKKLTYIQALSVGGRVINYAMFYIFAFVLTYIMVKRVFDY